MLVEVIQNLHIRIIWNKRFQANQNLGNFEYIVKYNLGMTND